MKRSYPIYLSRLSLIEVTALIEMANLGLADAEAWSEAECVSYEWTQRKASAGARALDKLKQYRDSLQAREDGRRS